MACLSVESVGISAFTKGSAETPWLFPPLEDTVRRALTKTNLDLRLSAPAL